MSRSDAGKSQKDFIIQPGVGRSHRPAPGDGNKMAATLKGLNQMCTNGDATLSGLMNVTDDYPRVAAQPWAE